MNRYRMTRGLLGLYAGWLALQAVPWLLDCGAAALQAIRERSAAPFLGSLGQGFPVVGGLVTALALAVLGGRLARLLVRGLPDSESPDGQPLLRAARAVMGAMLALTAVSGAAEAVWKGVRPAPGTYEAPPQVGTDLAVATLWLTAGLALFPGGGTLSRLLGLLTAQRPRR